MRVNPQIYTVTVILLVIFKESNVFWGISSNCRSPAQHAGGTNDKAKTYVQFTATTPFASSVAEGDGPLAQSAERGVDNAKVVSSTLTRTRTIYF